MQPTASVDLGGIYEGAGSESLRGVFLSVIHSSSGWSRIKHGWGFDDDGTVEVTHYSVVSNVSRKGVL